MEHLELFLAGIRDLAYTLAINPVSSVFSFLFLAILSLRLYCRLTLGVCKSDADMTGKTVLITGGTAGIGKATAEILASRNARVILACRNLVKADQVVKEIIAKTGNRNVIVQHLDLESFDSVRKCAEDVHKTEDKLHVLINNAGVVYFDSVMTKDGCERVLQSNHLGHFLLTLLLLDLLKKSAPSRIINVSSVSHTYGLLDLDDLPGKKCKGLDLYSRSKLANVLSTRELAKRLYGTGVTVNALCPGLVRTDVMNNSPFLFRMASRSTGAILGKSCAEGAQTTIRLAVDPELQKTTGKYFVDCKEAKLKGCAVDDKLAKRLFEVSEKIVGVSFRDVM